MTAIGSPTITPVSMFCIMKMNAQLMGDSSCISLSVVFRSSVDTPAWLYAFSSAVADACNVVKNVPWSRNLKYRNCTTAKMIDA